jgi:hypothetical protein
MAKKASSQTSKIKESGVTIVCASAGSIALNILYSIAANVIDPRGI